MDWAGHRLELGGLHVDQPGRYRMLARFVRDREMGTFRFDIDGTALEVLIDCYAPTPAGVAELSADVELGVVLLAAGEHVIGVETVGRHRDATGFLLAVDYFKLERVS